MALQLRKAGVTRVRPLLGGFAAWQDRGFPVESLIVGEVPATGAIH